jgi:hypothetical protein
VTAPAAAVLLLKAVAQHGLILAAKLGIGPWDSPREVRRLAAKTRRGVFDSPAGSSFF